MPKEKSPVSRAFVLLIFFFKLGHPPTHPCPQKKSKEAEQVLEQAKASVLSWNNLNRWSKDNPKNKMEEDTIVTTENTLN